MTIYDPETLRPGVPTTLTPSGPKPVGVADSEAYFARIVQNTDGTLTRASLATGSTYTSPLESASHPRAGEPILTLAPRDAAMLGLWQLIKDLTWYSYDLRAVASGNDRVHTTRSQFRDVVFDWPEWSKTDAPTGIALINSVETAGFDMAGFNPRLLEETADIYADGTVLRYLGEQRIPLSIWSWCAHKDQRRGLEAALLERLAVEQNSDLPGRRVLVPEYFNRPVLYQLTGTTRPDSPDGAGANEWVLQIELTAEIDHVQLVRIPGYFEGGKVDVE